VKLVYRLHEPAGSAGLFFSRVAMAAAILACLFLAGCATTKSDKPDGLSGPSPAVQSETSIVDSIEPVSGADKVLVVYFSQGNTTRTVAEDVAVLTGADVEVIVEKKSRAGFFGFMGAGMDSSFGTATPIDPPVHNPAEYDIVYVCTPVWAWSLCPPVRSWLRMFKGSLARAAFVTVSGDTDPDKIVAAMVKESGVQPFAIAGFAERDFYPENRDGYVAKIAALVEPAR